MMADQPIPCCEPASQFCELPYHWVQWRTPYRYEEPEPWAWNSKERMWLSMAGACHSPERAAQAHWHYVGPACPPTFYCIAD